MGGAVIVLVLEIGIGDRAADPLAQEVDLGTCTSVQAFDRPYMAHFHDQNQIGPPQQRGIKLLRRMLLQFL